MSFIPTILKDPQLNLPKQERAAILKQAANLWFAKPSNVLLYAGTTVFWVLLMIIAKPVMRSLGINSYLASFLVWGGIYPTMFIFTYWIIFNFNFLPFLYKELRTRQHDVCPKCGYILITLPESQTQCPECGTVRQPLPEPAPESDSAS
ncbi:MAG: hypothetical protein AB8C13_11210 [Phycisphaerales bacterium]